MMKGTAAISKRTLLRTTRREAIGRHRRIQALNRAAPQREVRVNQRREAIVRTSPLVPKLPPRRTRSRASGSRQKLPSPHRQKLGIPPPPTTKWSGLDPILSVYQLDVPHAVPNEADSRRRRHRQEAFVSRGETCHCAGVPADFRYRRPSVSS